MSDGGLYTWAPNLQSLCPGFVFMRQPHMFITYGDFLRVCLSIQFQIRQG